MFCTKCGKELPDGTRFCPACGKDLSEASQSAEIATPVAQGAAPVAGEAAAAAVDVAASTNEAAAPVAPAASTPAPAPKNTKLVRIAVVAAVVAVVAVLGLGIFAYLQFFSGTPIDEEHFPDKAFCSFVATNLDTDGNGKLSAQEIEKATVVDLSGQSGIADVTGVAVFTNMESFNLGPNTVANVDLSQNTHVTQVSTSTGSAEELKLPSGFDMQAGLDGAAGTKVESGDVTVQADEWTNNNNGKFGPLQRYNGVLYAGVSHAAASQQMSFDGATSFFGNTEAFHLANGRAYWVDNDPGNGSNAVSLYSANIDGSDKKTLASDVLSHSEMYYSNGYIYFSTFSTKPALTYINAATGERGTLPSGIASFVGACNNRLVVSQRTSQSASSYTSTSTLSFFDAATQEVTPIPSSEVNSLSQKAVTSDAGVLIASPLNGASLYSPEGTPVWSNMPFPSVSSFREVFPSLFMDDTSYYLVYETDYYKHDFTIERVNLETNEHTYIYFNAPDLNAPSETLQNSDYAGPLIKDSNSLIISISQVRSGTSGGYFTYRVSLDDGTAVLLQQSNS